MSPTPAPDMYAALRKAIIEDDERDAAVAALLRKRARDERARAAAYRGPVETHAQRMNGLGAIMAEADWEAELYLLDILFIDAEESHLP